MGIAPPGPIPMVLMVDVYIEIFHSMYVHRTQVLSLAALGFFKLKFGQDLRLRFCYNFEDFEA